MPSQDAIERFMLESARKNGEFDSRLKNIEEGLGKVSGKLDDVAKTMTLARGGWVALMATIGIFASLIGAAVGIVKLFFSKEGGA